MTRLAAALVASAAVSGCVGAGIDVSYWKPSLSADLRVEGGGSPGDLVDLQSELDVQNEDAIPIERIWCQVGPSRYEFGRWDLSVEGQATVGAAFVFGGSTYSVSDVVDTEVDVAVWRAAYYFCPKLGRFKVGVGIALQWWEVEAELDNQTAAFTEKLDESYPIPAIAARIEVPVNFFMVAFGEVDAIDVSFEDIEGHFIDSRVGMRFKAPKTLSAVVAYRRVNTDVAIEGDSADLDFEGLILAVETRW